MEQIGYKPPKVKRGPKGGPRRVAPTCMRTGQIAVLTLGGFQQWLSMPVMASVVAGVTRAAKELDIRPVLDEMPDPAALSPVLRRREVDGVIVFVHSGIPESCVVNLRAHLPVVWAMGGESGAPEVDHVSADNIGIGRLAQSYLASKGCTRVAFVTNAASWHIMRLRGQSFANAARDAGQQVTSFVQADNPAEAEPYGPKVITADSLEKLIDLLAAARPRPDGLFIPTDLLATQVYPLLLHRGIKPEQDIRVISCDNEAERLSMLKPRPASIDIRGEEIGRLAVRQLIQRLERPNDPATRIQVAPRIVCPDE